MARILLIDDDDSLRTMLHLTLTHFGHTVTAARNGREGLEKFRQTGADLVITDIVMPEQDGLEFLMALRAEPVAVKVIAMSGGGRRSPVNFLHVAKLLGATKVLAKPFSNAALLAAIDELLPHPAPDAIGA